MKNQPEEESVVPVEQDKSYEELVDPDETGEAPERGERPYVGQLGPDLTDPPVTNGVDNATEENELDEYGNNR